MRLVLISLIQRLLNLISFLKTPLIMLDSLSLPTYPWGRTLVKNQHATRDRWDIYSGAPRTGVVPEGLMTVQPEPGYHGCRLLAWPLLFQIGAFDDLQKPAPVPEESLSPDLGKEEEALPE